MATNAVATAFVSIVPSMKGFAGSLQAQLGGEMDTAGVEGGKRLGSGLVASAKSFVGPLIATFGAFAAVDFFKGSIESASNLAESQNAIKVTFGDAAGAIAKLGEDSATRLGLSTAAFNGVATQFSAFAGTIAGSGGDISKVVDDLSTRGADFASVMNLDVNDALGLFQSGLAGETEPLRKYGIDMSAAAVEAYALSKGIWDGTGQMTEAQKVQARYGSLMEQTSKTQGDFANTADGVANTQRIANAEIENARAKFGDALLPIVATVTKFFADNLVPALEGAGKGFQWVKDNVGWLAPVLAGLGAILLGIATYIGIMNLAAVIAAAGGFPAIIASTWAWTAALLANPVTWIILGIGLLIAAIVALAMNWDTVVAWVSDVWGGFVGWFGDVMNGFVTWWNDLWAGIGKWLEDVWNGIVDFFVQYFPYLMAIILGPLGLIIGLIIQNWEAVSKFIQDTWNAIVDFFVTIGKAIGDWWTALWDGIITFFTNAFNGYVSFVFGIFRNLLSFFTGMGRNISNWWNGLWTGVIDFFKNIFSGIGDFVSGVFQGVVGFIKGYINMIIDIVNGAIEGINAVAGAVADATGGAIDVRIGKIPHLAKGGLVTQPTTALIGEKGPEVVTPLKDFERMMGLGQGNGATVNYYAAPNQSLDAEQALTTALKRAKVLAAW